MKFYEERIESKRVFEGKMISVRVDYVRLPDGKVSTREVVDHPGAVVIVPVLGEKILSLNSTGIQSSRSFWSFLRKDGSRRVS